MQEYRENIKRAYILQGKDAEKEDKKYIDYLAERRHTTSDQKQHLEKYNKNLSNSFK